MRAEHEGNGGAHQNYKHDPTNTSATTLTAMLKRTGGMAKYDRRWYTNHHDDFATLLL